jgi:GTP-binding protein LepA
VLFFLLHFGADVVRLDVLVADEPVIAFARVVSRRRVEKEAELMVEKLHSIMPRELFTYKIQAKALGRIISSRSISGKKKDAAGTLSGGDITRKMKLREKQKEGRKRLKEHGSVNIPQEVFVKIMRSGE